MPLSKEQQIAEAEARGGRGEEPAEGAGANADLHVEPGAQDAPARAQERDADGAPIVPPERRRPDPRDAIVENMRRSRATSDAAEDAAELRAFANAGLPPEMAEPEPVAQPEAAAEEPEPELAEPEAPARRKLTIRGQEVELTEDEIIAAAQKHLAADNYLDEARAKLERVNDLLRQTEQGVRQPARAHPAGEEAETPEPVADEHPVEDPYVTAVRDIAFKTPEEAAATLKALVNGEVSKAAGQAADEKLQGTRKSDELARNRRALEEFSAKHANIANDRRAVAAIKDDIAQMQRADIAGLGVPDAQIPTDPVTLGQWHLHYRAEGHKVRPMAELLEKGISNYQEWKGETSTPATRRQEPRVVLTPQREARRASIPQQPTRAVTPRPDAQTQPQPRDRSAVVAQMQRDRANKRLGIARPGTT